jgi:hypothetical protein
MPAVSGLPFAELLAFPTSDGALRPLLPGSLVTRQQVGAGSLRREDMTLLDGGQVAVLAQAVGAPRLWGLLLDSALDAFVDGYRRAGQVSTSSRLHQGLLMASHYVRERTDALLDRGAADVYLLAVAVEGGAAHVLRCGPQHVYLARQNRLRRIGDLDDPHDTHERARGSQGAAFGGDTEEGVRKGTSSFVSEPLEAGDLLFAGSDLVCDEGLLATLVDALSRDRSLSTQAVVEAIGASAAQRELGAGSFALRLPGPPASARPPEGTRAPRPF